MADLYPWPRRPRQTKPKKCIICRELKPLADYPRVGINKASYQARCKACVAKKKREKRKAGK